MDDLKIIETAAIATADAATEDLDMDIVLSFKLFADLVAQLRAKEALVSLPPTPESLQ